MEKCSVTTMSTVKALSKKPAKGLIQMNRRQNAEKTAGMGKDYINWFENMFPQYAKVKSAWFHAKLAKIIIEN